MILMTNESIWPTNRWKSKLESEQGIFHNYRTREGNYLHFQMLFSPVISPFPSTATLSSRSKEFSLNCILNSFYYSLSQISKLKPVISAKDPPNGIPFVVCVYDSGIPVTSHTIEIKLQESISFSIAYCGISAEAVQQMYCTTPDITVYAVISCFCSSFL